MKTVKVVVLISNIREKGVERLINSHGTILSTLTDLIRKLVELGYITREKSEKDSRVVGITPTEKGWKFKSLFEEISNNFLEKTYKDFTEKEKETLIFLLDKIRKNYQN